MDFKQVRDTWWYSSRMSTCKLRTMQRSWWSLHLSLALHLTSGVRRRGAVWSAGPCLAFTENNAIDVSIQSELRGSLHREISGGWLARGDVAWGSATMKRARNNRWKREYRRETYEVDLPPHCVRRRVSKTKSCHVGRHQRHRPGLAIPLVVGPLFRSTGNEGRTAGYPLFSFTYAPRRETPRWRVCETDVTARLGVGAWVSTQLQTCAWPVDTVCVVSTYTVSTAAHARALSNFREGPEDSPSRFLGAELRARKRPSDWIDRNFKYILRPDGSSGEPPAGLWKISSILVALDVISWTRSRIDMR